MKHIDAICIQIHVFRIPR